MCCRIETCNPEIAGDLGGLEDLGTVDRSLPPVEWDGSRELAEAPPEVTGFFIVIFLDPDPESMGSLDRSLPPVEWDGSRELAEAPPEVPVTCSSESSFWIRIRISGTVPGNSPRRLRR
jgi:hypothetical protein